MTHARTIRPVLATLAMASLFAPGCDPDLDPLERPVKDGEYSRPTELAHDELFDDEDVPPPPEEDAFTEESDPTGIYGGTVVNSCGWPSTVGLGGSCTGTLIHPQVVIYAAHCGASYSQIYFGESYNAPARVVAPSWCKIYPGGGPGDGDDFAVCRLAQAVNDVPIVPPLMGCETEILKPGQAVTLVGFGNADNGPYGIKRQVTTTINGIQGNEISIGGNGKDTCQGDSGGPAFVRLADGTWRVFGITSYGGACGQGGWYSMMHKGMAWFEQQTGLDLTPCHTAAGVWSPGPGCGDFLTNPGPGGDSWAGGCESGGRSGVYSSTCGAPYAQQPAPQPAPQPQPAPVPCVGCTEYAGSLSGPGDFDQHPNGQYYQSKLSGVHEGYLVGPGTADFDLYLYRWNGSAWSLVAKSEGQTSTETIKFNGTPGFYAWIVESYSGSGSYKFWLKRPA